MRAVRFHGREDIRIDEIPDPVCRPNKVIVAPSFCGICGSDLHEFINGPTEYPAEPHPLTGECVPLTLGHEFSGVITEIGDEVTTLSKGDRVVVNGVIYCGKCEPCLGGNQHVCIASAYMGQHGGGGGLAEKISCPAEQVFKLPDHVGLDVAALCEPLTVCEHAIQQVQPEVQPHQTALVLGCGAIGLGIVQLLQARGLSRIIVSEISKTRREAALKFGASHAGNPNEVDVAKEIRQLTDGAGPHLVFECAGVPASMDTAIDVVRIHGTIIGVALATKKLPIDSNSLVYKEVTYKGSVAQTPKDWESVISRLGDKSLQPEAMITRIVRMEKVVEDGIMGLARGDEGLVKILVEVNPSKSL